MTGPDRRAVPLGGDGRAGCPLPGPRGSLGPVAVKKGVYRGLTAQERAAERRERLLEATLEVWGREGGPPVTMTRICQQAQLTERYFYEQFANLEEALEEVLKSIYEEIVEVTAAALEQTSGDPADRARIGIAAFLDVFVKDPRKGRVAMILAPGRAELRERRQEMLRSLSSFAAMEAGELYGEEAEPGPRGELAGILFVGGLSELVAGWIEGTLETDPAELVDAATRAFTRLAHR